MLCGCFDRLFYNKVTCLQSEQEREKGQVRWEPEHFCVNCHFCFMNWITGPAHTQGGVGKGGNCLEEENIGSHLRSCHYWSLALSTWDDYLYNLRLEFTWDCFKADFTFFFLTFSNLNMWIQTHASDLQPYLSTSVYSHFPSFLFLQSEELSYLFYII